MKILRVTLFWGAAVLFGQDAVVQKSSIWIDTVKRGDMTRAVRGGGVLGANKMAELRIPESQAQQIRSGQPAIIDTGNGLAKGKVTRVEPVANGTVKVEVQLEGDLPAGAVDGLNVDGLVQVETLRDVIYVGRPVAGSPQSEDTLFKLDADKQHVTKVKVQYGRAAVNTIEVRSGLQPGDQVILSDMTAFAGKDHIRLQ